MSFDLGNANDSLLRRALLPRDEAVRSARSKVSMIVARLIADDVAARGLRPGAHLPTEQEMAAHFDVGRPSVREALRILEAHGLIRIKTGQGGGPIVRRPTPADHGQTLSLFMQMRGVTYRDALKMHTRVAGIVAEEAAERVAAGKVDHLEALIASSRSNLGDGRDDASFLSSGTDFHGVLLELAGNETLTLIAGALGYVFAVRTAHVHAGHWDDEERRIIAAEHQALAAAIESGSTQLARRLGEAHVAQQVTRMLESDPGLLDEVVDWR